MPLPDSFESVAREWHKRQSQKWNPRHADRVLQRLINDIFPWIGLKTINAIDASELLAAVKRIEDRGGQSNQLIGPNGYVVRYFVMV